MQISTSSPSYSWLLPRRFVIALFPCIAWFTLISGPLAWAADEDDEPLGDETVTLQTRDGLALKATYFASTEGKKAVPILLLHDFKGDRHDFDGLAASLQKEGKHAVLVPDLRGHGDSTRFAGAARGRELTPSRMRRNDFLNMISEDGNAIFKFLRGRNNAGELNLNKLCIVGAGMGSVIALHWAQGDWNQAIRPFAPDKSPGQNVRGLVLLSPTWDFKGVPIKPAITHQDVLREISVLIVVGGDNSSAARDAKRLHKTFLVHHPMPEGPRAAEKQDLFYHAAKTSLQGMKLLKTAGLGINSAIAKFIELRLAEQDFPWTNRKIRGT